jgi:hypothetical protein
MTPEEARDRYGAYSPQYAEAIEAAKRQDPDDVDGQAAAEWLARWDMFAAAALPALAARTAPHPVETIAGMAGMLADAMMAYQPGSSLQQP